MKQKVLNLLGLATRAGKIISGEEMVVKNIKRIKLVFLGKDTGPNTSKKIKNKCEYYNVELVDMFTIDELSKAIGKNNRVVCACTDDGFVGAIKKLLEEVT